MTPRLPLGWRERLDQLRREQNPGLYHEEQPALQIPLPAPPRDVPEDPTDNGEEPEQGRGVIIIDI